MENTLVTVWDHLLEFIINYLKKLAISHLQKALLINPKFY